MFIPFTSAALGENDSVGGLDSDKIYDEARNDELESQPSRRARLLCSGEL
jgi:hypothetical protein